MSRLVCLFLLGFAACTGNPQLADLPGLTITFSANAAEVRVWIEHCEVLDESFRATVGGDEIPIKHPGSTYDGCTKPYLELRAPPAADAIVLADDSKEVTIPLEGRLARLLPERPWIAEVGATVEVRYEPAGSVVEGKTRLVLEPVEGAMSYSLVTFSASSGKLTFEVPDHPGSRRLSLAGFANGGIPVPVPCQGATCRVVAPYTQDTGVPIEIRTPAMM